MRKRILVAFLAGLLAGGIAAPMFSFVGWQAEATVWESRTGLGFILGATIGAILGSIPILLADGFSKRTFLRTLTFGALPGFAAAIPALAIWSLPGAPPPRVCMMFSLPFCAVAAAIWCSARSVADA